MLGSPLFLGASVDGEPDGQPNGAATGDDTDADGDDEDGVTFTRQLFNGLQGEVEVVVTDTLAVGGFLDAWVDFDQDGVFGAGEKIIGQAVVAGSTNIVFNVPAGAQLGNTFARFRLNSAGNLPADGAAIDGEVEDYRVEILPPRSRTRSASSIRAPAPGPYATPPRRAPRTSSLATEPRAGSR